MNKLPLTLIYFKLAIGIAIIFLSVLKIENYKLIAILPILKKWTNDVPSFYHSLQLRRGKEIKRHKMFNG